MQFRFAKPTILALLASTLLVGQTLAQDAVAADWSGFYAGVYAGYGLDKLPATSSSTVLPFAEGEDDELIFATIEQSFNGVDGSFGGLRGGWSYQHGAFVMGLESSLTLGSFTRNSSASLFATDEEDPPSSLYQSSSSSFETNAIATFEGRIGVALDNWLLYGKAGVAVAHGTTDASSLSSYVDGDEPEESIEIPVSGSTSGLLFGSTIGIGAEMLLTETISVGAEYNFVHLPAQELNLINIGLGDIDSSQGTIGIHTLKASVNYHF